LGRPVAGRHVVALFAGRHVVALFAGRHVVALLPDAMWSPCSL